MKRGVELSMNVIIIAAIALIILVVLVLLVSGAFSRVKDGTGCESLTRGQCVDIFEGDSCSDELGSGYVRVASDCPESRPVCCWQPLEQEEY